MFYTRVFLGRRFRRRLAPNRLEDPYWGVGLDLALEEETKKWFPVSNSSKEVREWAVCNDGYPFVVSDACKGGGVAGWVLTVWREGGPRDVLREARFSMYLNRLMHVVGTPSLHCRQFCYTGSEGAYRSICTT